MPQERLQKIIARAGYASRREAEVMIRSGLVTVNGRVVSELGSKADPDEDHIKVRGKLITRPEKRRYILLYKPREVMTTVDDPEGRTTVMKYLRDVKERVFPVGRLDYQSEGLILLTNDGELAYRLMHPSHGTVKTYHVKVRGVPEERVVDKLRRGITIEGRRTLPAEIDRIKTTGRRDDEGNSWFEVRLREGRTQQIRRMFQAMGHPVTKLKRIAIGPIADARLTAGQWRELTRDEIRLLASGREARAKTRAPSKKRPASPKKTTGAAAATRHTARSKESSRSRAARRR